MNISNLVREKIESLEDGKTLKFKDFNIEEGKELALGKALSREVKNGNLKRLQKGVYFKMKKSKFGNLRTPEEEIIKSELFKNNKQIGYITGLRLYNKMGLTTQLSTAIEIKLNTNRNNKFIDNRKIIYKLSKTKIVKDNIYLLQLLDCIQNINKIPDSNVIENYKILSEKIRKLSQKEQGFLIEISMDYLPKTRAVLGMILSECTIDIKELKRSINNLSQYKLGLKTIKNAKDWNVI